MLRFIPLMLFTVFCLTSSAQDSTLHHKGFFFSAAAGPAVGQLHVKWDKDKALVEGGGLAVDMRLGGNITENLLFHGIALVEIFPGNFTRFSGETPYPMPANLSYAEIMVGAGATYYFMPSNVFISASMGLGGFSVFSAGVNEQFGAGRGLAVMLRAGKEWWIAKNVALGIAAGYNKTYLNEPVDYYTETLNTDRFTLQVVFTYQFSSSIPEGTFRMKN